MTDVTLGRLRKLDLALGGGWVELENLPGYQVGPCPLPDSVAAVLAVGDVVLVADLGQNRYAILDRFNAAPLSIPSSDYVDEQVAAALTAATQYAATGDTNTLTAAAQTAAAGDAATLTAAGQHADTGDATVLAAALARLSYGGVWAVGTAYPANTLVSYAGGLFATAGTAPAGAVPTAGAPWQQLVPPLVVDTWQVAALTAPWTMFGGAYRPNLSYMRDLSGWVTVEGLITRTTASGSNSQVTVLPAGYRPAYNLPPAAALNNSSTAVCRLDITTAGTILVTGSVAGWVSINTRFRAEQ